MAAGISTVESLTDNAKSAVDVDLLLDRHEETIRNLPNGEANNHRRARICAAIEAELADLLAVHGPLPRALVLHAELPMLHHQWPEGVRRWEKVAEQSAEHRALAHLKMALAHRNTGNFYATKIALTEAEKAGIDKKDPSFRREKRALSNAIHAWMSAWLIQKSLNNVKKGNEENAISLFRSGMLLKGTNARTLQFAVSVFRKLVWLAEEEVADRGKTVARPANAHHQPKGPSPKGLFASIVNSLRTLELRGSSTPIGPTPVVLSSGFGWSGSGAVTDYLREFAPVSLPFGDKELGWFELEHGASGILRAARKNRGALKDALIDFFLVHVLGVVKNLHDAKIRRKIESRSVVRYFSGSELGIAELESACMETFEAIHNYYDGETGSIIHPLQTFFNRIFMAKSDVNGMIVLNNVIHGQNISMIKVLPNSRAFLVVRDPRDQFVAQLAESVSAPSKTGFINGQKVKLRRCRTALNDPDIARSVDVVRFEDFVFSAEVRHAVRDRLGLREADRSGSQHFFPERSQHNVGIYRHHRNQEDIAHIHEELAPYLIEPTLRAGDDPGPCPT